MIPKSIDKIYKTTKKMEQRAMNICRVIAPTEKSERLARALVNLKRNYNNHDQKRQARSIVFLEEAPKQEVVQKHTNHTCKATTLKGKPCSFKAVCGGYCKKHGISMGGVSLGKKIVV
jgi:hypothetical protein